MPELAAHLEFAKRRLMIMSAPNGARRTTHDHPAIPVTATGLADCARTLVAESVGILHLHVRDENQGHSLDVGLYRDAISEVKRAVGDALVLQVTSEAVGIFSRQQQESMVRELRPEAVSLALRELCPDEQAESDASRFFAWLVREHIWPQYILYSPQDLVRFDQLRRNGFFGEERPFAMFVLGAYANGRDGRPSDLDNFLGTVDCSEFPWAVCCFGPQEKRAALLADSRGGHVRLGFENNLVLDDGTTAGGNAALVAQFNASRAAGARNPATASEIREFIDASRA